MRTLIGYQIAAIAALTAASPPAGASPHNVCVPRAQGVPTRNEPPKWVGWAGAPGSVDEALDDPRWAGSTGHSFEAGSAKAPLQLRALWSSQGGEYLYLSFIMDIEGLDGTGTETARDLFLGFRRAIPFDPGTPQDPTDDHRGYIFQFHLKGGASPTLVDPIHCARPLDSQQGPGNTFDGCSEDAAQPKDHWRLYVDLDQPGGCSGPTTGRLFTALTGPLGVMDSPAPWMASKQAVRYWKMSTANRWAIQLRIPIVAPGQPITAGIERGSRFWYQATAVAAAGNFTSLGWWPRDLATSICYSAAAGGLLGHDELIADDKYSGLTTISGAPPAGIVCDGGIRLTSRSIGSFPDFSDTPEALDTLVPTTTFRGLRSDGTPAVNTVVAQLENTSSTVIEKPLMARFRLAEWGSAPWSNAADIGTWKDMRGTIPTVADQQPGICLGSSSPNAADTCMPAVTIPAGGRKAIWFQWTLGTDPTLGASELCKYGLTPPGATSFATGCAECSCATSPACDVPSDPGIRALGGTTPPCVSKRHQHQCVLVELTAPRGVVVPGTPHGGVDFVQQSAWNNMSFASMSTVAREALIDARRLPVGKGQRYQDIYLIAMPRNMPRTIPGGRQDGARLIRERVLSRAEQLGEPYRKDLGRLPQSQIDEIINKLNRPPLVIPGHGPNIPPIIFPPGHGPNIPPIVIPPGHGPNIPPIVIPPGHGPNIPPIVIPRGLGLIPKGPDLGNYADRLRSVQRPLAIMSDKDLALTGRLLRLMLTDAKADDLTKAVVREIGPEEAARVVPTLEIYPFYRPLDTGKAYLPMTAFTVFLSHEGAMNGMTWQIDGATQVGQNVYHLRIPVGLARRIQVRAQAIEGTDPPPAPPNPKWPCGGCCAPKSCGLVAQTGNALPGLLAGLYAVRGGHRRRRRPMLAAPRP
jgi:hypothetical protein